MVLRVELLSVKRQAIALIFTSCNFGEQRGFWSYNSCCCEIIVAIFDVSIINHHWSQIPLVLYQADVNKAVRKGVETATQPCTNGHVLGIGSII